MSAVRSISLRTWYGIDAAVDIRDRSWHRAGFRKLLLLHPPLFNWLLRRGLPFVPYRKLAVLHEFGHLQWLPGILVYLFASFFGVYWLRKVDFWNVLLLLLGAHLLWELLAESYVRQRTGRYYRNAYRKTVKWPRWTFAIGTALFFAGTWTAVLWRN